MRGIVRSNMECVSVTLGIARKLLSAVDKKYPNILLTGLLGCIKPVIVMANEPALDKVVLSFQIPAELDVKLRKEAKRRSMSKSALIDFLLFEATKNIPLSSEDYVEISKIVRKNEEKRNRKRLS